MIFNTIQEKVLAEQLMTKLENVDGFFYYKCFDSSIQNFLMWNQYAIKTRDVSKFDPVCIMNGIHKISNHIQKLFESVDKPIYAWKLLTYLLFVYDPFYELSEEEINEIQEFLTED